MAAELRRRVGAPAAGGSETVALTADLGQAATAENGEGAAGSGGDRRPCGGRALVLDGAAHGYTIGTAALAATSRGST